MNAQIAEISSSGTIAQASELAEVNKAVAAFDRVEAGLAQLREKYRGVVYEVTTAEGMKAAKEARLAIREPRYEVERIRKGAKAPLLALGKRLDAEAARITAELESLEAPVHQQIKAEEDRKETERQERIAAEMKRVEDLQRRLAAIRAVLAEVANAPAADVLRRIGDLESLAIDESFQEFMAQAASAKVETLDQLRALHRSALEREAEQERIRAEREELARLRNDAQRREVEAREQQAAQERAAEAERARIAEEERQARERIAAEERKAREASQAEADRQAEDLRRQREELDRLKAEGAEARAAEEARIAEQRAEVERREREAQEAEDRRLGAEKQEAERSAREKEERQAREDRRKQAFANPPTALEIAKVITEHFEVELDVAIFWLMNADFSALVVR